MEDFYTRVMGLVVTDRGKAFRFPIDLVFLSSRPDFRDPEGNRIEVYLDSPWHVPQPHGDELNLEISDEDILKTTLEAIKDDPGFMPREEFEAELKRKLAPDAKL